MCLLLLLFLFFFTATATTEIYPLSLHDALPISDNAGGDRPVGGRGAEEVTVGAHDFTRQVHRSSLPPRSEEHTSELQSRVDLVCRLLLEKKKTKEMNTDTVSIMRTVSYSDI